MNRMLGVVGVALLGLSVFGSQPDYGQLRKEIEELKARLSEQGKEVASGGAVGQAEAVVGNKYGPDAIVTTKQGKLEIGGLLQVWNYNIMNDNQDANGAYASTNELYDNNSYRIRRAELKFTVDITEDLTGVIIIDPTGGDEANTFPGIPSNQGVVGKGWLSGGPEATRQDIQDYFTSNQTQQIVTRRNMQSGYVKPNRLLQDAYINYHSSLIPHHDFTLGQFKPPIGEEGNRNSGQLDFVERAMINQFSNQRDLGIMAHGSWWDSRFQYWVGGFDTPGSFQNTFASFQNRSDDNDSKDIAFKLMVRPVWQMETWGSLEMGYSRQDGVHGESGKGYVTRDLNADTFADYVTGTVDGLSIQEAHASRQYAWVWYRPGGPVKGWWLRGEWGQIKDRPLPGSVGMFNVLLLQPQVFKRDGWYFSTGYRMSNSIWGESLKNGNTFEKMLEKLEFAFRYETFGNLIADDLITPPTGEVDVFKTNVYTAGINVYWKGYNVRTQFNYLWVDEDQGNTGTYADGTTSRRIREVDNNVFIISNQVQW